MTMTSTSNPPSVAARTFDARPMLARGEHPKEQVMGNLEALVPGEVFELLTPFLPGPLVDLARGRGFEAQTEGEAGLFRTRFRRV